MGPRDFHYSTLRVLEREVGGAGGGCLISRVLGGLLAWAGLGRLLGAFGAALGRLCGAVGPALCSPRPALWRS